MKQGSKVPGTQLNNGWVEKIGGEFFVGDKSSSVKLGKIIVFSKDGEGNEELSCQTVLSLFKMEGLPKTQDRGV